MAGPGRLFYCLLDIAKHLLFQGRARLARGRGLVVVVVVVESPEAGVAPGGALVPAFFFLLHMIASWYLAVGGRSSWVAAACRWVPSCFEFGREYVIRRWETVLDERGIGLL